MSKEIATKLKNWLPKNGIQSVGVKDDGKEVSLVVYHDKSFLVQNIPARFEGYSVEKISIGRIKPA